MSHEAHAFVRNAKIVCVSRRQYRCVMEELHQVNFMIQKMHSSLQTKQDDNNQFHKGTKTLDDIFYLRKYCAKLILMVHRMYMIFSEFRAKRNHIVEMNDEIDDSNEDQNVYAKVIQTRYRLWKYRKPIKSMRKAWSFRKKYLNQSESLYWIRHGMILQDRMSHEFRDAELRSIKIQTFVRKCQAIQYVKQLRIRLAAEEAMAMQEMSEHDRIEKFKREMREELNDKRSIAQWRCEICAKFRFRYGKPGQFKSWAEIEAHQLDHTLLDAKRQEVHAQKQLENQQLIEATIKRKQDMQDRERGFLQDLRSQRQTKQQNRFASALVLRGTLDFTPLSSCLSLQDLQHSTAKYVLLHLGENRIGRNSKEMPIDSLLLPKLVSKDHLLISMKRTDSGESLVAMACDNQSTNGTSINGILMNPGREYILEYGDILTLGVCPNNRRRKNTSDIVFEYCKVDTFVVT